jgi:hypothetical protein
MRLISIGQYHLNGHINFKTILLFCWLFLATIQLLLCKSYPKNDWFKVSIGFLILNPLHHEMIFRTDVATYQLATIAMSVFMIYMAYNFKEANVLLKAIFLLIFLITPGGSINGLLASVFVVFVFYQQKNKPYLYLSAVILILQLFFMFGLKTESKSIGFTENIIKYNWRLVVAYFMSLGGMFHIRSTDDFKVFSTIIGLLIWAIGIKIFVWKNPKNWDYLTMIFLFCSLSLAAIVALRYNYWMVGYDSVLESRYKMYGAVIVALISGFAYQNIKSSAVRLIVLCLIILLFGAGFYKADFLLKVQKLTQLTDAWNINQNVIDSTFARNQYTSASNVLLLKENKAFDFNLKSEVLKKQLQGADVLPFRNFEIKASQSDLSKNADWIHSPFPLKTLTVYGQFKKYSAYIIEFKRADGKSALFFLFGKPMTIKEKLIGKSPIVNELNHDFNYDFIRELDSSKVTLYGLNSLPN